MHRREVAKIDEEQVPTELLSAAQEAWDTAVELAERHGVRNSQATVLAPTGTISFLMDCDTTGIEPDLGLVKTKKLVGGGTMSIVNQTVPRALQRLGYSRGGDRRDRRLHRRAQVHRRRAESACGAPSGLRLFDGGQHDPLPRAREDDGGCPAVHLGRHIQDCEHPRGRHCRGSRADARRRLEDGPEGGRHLPRQLQGRPAACDDEAGRAGGTARAEDGSASPSGGHAREGALLERIAELEGALQERHVVAPATTTRTRLPRASPVEHLRLPRGRLRGLCHRRRVRGRSSRRGLHEGLQAGLDAVGRDGRLLDLGQPRAPARRAACRRSCASTPTCASSRRASPTTRSCGSPRVSSTTSSGVSRSTT